MDQSQDREESHDNLKDQSGSSQQTCDLQCAQSNFRETEDNLTEEVGQSTMNSVPSLKDVSECMSRFNLEQMKTSELIQLQKELTNYQSKITNVFIARCSSPPPP